LKNIAGETIADREVTIRSVEAIEMSMTPPDENPIVG